MSLAIEPLVADRLALHPPIPCGSCGKELSPTLGKLDQSGAPLDAAIYACVCEWKRIVPLKVAR
jgi:hypothetical protein